MSEPSKPTGWWHTLPGILTGVAALVTALSGLIALLAQNGLLDFGKDKDKRRPAPPPAVQAPAPQTPQAQAPAVSPQDSGPTARANDGAAALAGAWADAVALITLRDGRTTQLRAASFRHCISVQQDLTLDNGQTIPFEKMYGFKVPRADPPTAPGAKARLLIRLLDGSEISGSMDATCDLFGTNDLGRFSTTFDKVQNVRFERAHAPSADRPAKQRAAE